MARAPSEGKSCGYEPAAAVAARNSTGRFCAIKNGCNPVMEDSAMPDTERTRERVGNYLVVNKNKCCDGGEV